MILQANPASSPPGGVSSERDVYAVIGNPVAHSRSPQIHAEFALQTGAKIVYRRLLAPLDGFANTVHGFFAQGGKGLNVTTPFKMQAYDLADHLTPRARAAGAVNTLWRENGCLYGDNTDGIGLITDIQHNLGVSLAGSRVLVLGAGGAARGVMLPLIACNPDCIIVLNRTPERADSLLKQFALAADQHKVALCGGGFDMLCADLKQVQVCEVIINATASSLQGETLPVPQTWLRRSRLVYDMMYGVHTPLFLAQAAKHEVRISDGLGMLVEQAAEAFRIWRGMRPETTLVLSALRAALQ